MDVSVSGIAEDNIKAGRSGLLLVADNYDAFAVRVLAARSSVRTLDLMYFLWHDDHTGRLQEAVRAAERGVRVRMLLDDVNPRKSDSAYRALSNHPNNRIEALQSERHQATQHFSRCGSSVANFCVDPADAQQGVDR